VRIFDLEPKRRTPGAIRRAEALRDDALATEFAGEYDVAVAFEKLV
jgi:hypothetical protein